MSDAAVTAKRMTVEEFLAWQEQQDRNYELVDGIPVLPIKSMTGAKIRHNRVTVNAISALNTQLIDSPCQVLMQDIAIRTGAATTRRPDVAIDCGSPALDAMIADRPTVVIEVLSPSTMRIDRIQKLNEYQRTAGIDVILLVDTEKPLVIVYRRAVPAWTVEEAAGLSAVVELPEVGARLPLDTLYARLPVGREAGDEG